MAGPAAAATTAAQEAQEEIITTLLDAGANLVGEVERHPEVMNTLLFQVCTLSISNTRQASHPLPSAKAPPLLTLPRTPESTILR